MESLFILGFIFVWMFALISTISSAMKSSKRKEETRDARKALENYRNQLDDLEEQYDCANSWAEEMRIQEEMNRLQQQMINDQNLINMGMDMQNLQDQQSLDMQMQQMNDFMDTSLNNVTPFEMGGMDMTQGNSFNDMNNCGGFNDFGGGMGMF